MAGKKRKKRKKKRIGCLIPVLMICAVLIGHLAARVTYQYNYTLSLLDRETGIDLNDVEVDEDNLVYEKRISNILLVGADKRESWKEAGRSDSVMILTIDQEHKQLKLTSLMRDLYIPIPGHGETRFNSAYSYGGISLLYQTVAQNFGIRVDGYAIVDFAAFKDVINEIGGVEIELTDAEYKYLTTAYAKTKGTVKEVTAGLNNMNGEQALAYTRIRQDAKADFGRTQRQRTVLQSVFAKVKTMPISELLKLAEKILPSITTDLSNEEITSYIMMVLTMGTTEFEQFRIPVDNSFTNQRIGGMAVLVPDMAWNVQELHKFIFEKVE